MLCLTAALESALRLIGFGLRFGDRLIAGSLTKAGLALIAGD
jgi:hypothetical protein